VLQTLWRDNPASFEAAGLRIDDIHCMPKPVQPGGVPIWVSGTVNRRVLSRIVRYGSGWIPWGPWLDDPAPGIPIVRRELGEAGRDPDSFGFMATLQPAVDADGVPDLAATFESVGALTEAGITDFRVRLLGSGRAGSGPRVPGGSHGEVPARQRPRCRSGRLRVSWRLTMAPARPDARDRIELAELLSAYARCVDRRDYDGLARLFAAGSRVGKFESRPGGQGAGYWREGGTQFAASVRANHARYAVTTHLLGQHAVHIDGDSASGETYYLAHHIFRQDGRWIDRVMAIRYLDQYSRSPDGWLFAERRLFVDWIEYRPTGSEPTADGWQPA
jgi:SnoaL-like domain/Luciferase-like monooxygenase